MTDLSRYRGSVTALITPFKDGAVDDYLWGHDLLATSIALGRGGEHILTGSADCTARVWDLRWKEQLARCLWRQMVET